MKSIVVFSGGTGTKNLNTSLFKEYNKKKYKLYFIINCYDNGKSTGVLRDIFFSKILGSSDVRKLHSQQYHYFKKKKLSNFFTKRITIKKIEDIRNYIINNKIHNLPKKFKNLILKDIKIFEKRLKKILINKTILKDISFANIVYSILAYKYKSITKAESIIRRHFDLPFEVVVNSEENYFLSSINKKNSIIMDEENIVNYEKKIQIKDIFLTKKQLKNLKIKNIYQYLKNNSKNFPKINKKLPNIIQKSNIIIYGPGTQYSSLYPTYLTSKLSKYIINSQALKIYISNYKADNDTPNFSQNDLLNKTFFYLNKKKSLNLYNQKYIDIVFMVKSQNTNKALSVNLKDIKKLNFRNIFFETKSRINKIVTEISIN